MQVSKSRDDVQYPPSEVGLSGQEWIAAAVIIVAVLGLAPRHWRSVEPFDPPADYRIPYELSSDYWLFERYGRLGCSGGKTPVIGDSVMWGHYVAKEHTLPSRLSAIVGDGRFFNMGVDGLHPAAMAGLIEHYGQSVSGTNVILHCNLLWMSSKRHDLQVDKEISFNHPRLVPQFFPRIRCYGERTSGRLGIIIGRKLAFSGWAEHLRLAYFDRGDIPTWTMEHPWDNPLGAISLQVVGRGEGRPAGPSEEPWTRKQMTSFEPAWVELETSFQWRSFRRTVEILQGRGNRLFVIVGPFNEHMLKGASLEVYRQRVNQVETWLRENRIAHYIPAALPSEQYADASHPLRGGYDMLARELLEDRSFAEFDGRRAEGPAKKGSAR